MVTFTMVMPRKVQRPVHFVDRVCYSAQTDASDFALGLLCNSNKNEPKQLNFWPPSREMNKFNAHTHTRACANNRTGT